MTTILLIRHATTDSLGRKILSGRAPGVPLNEQGRREAEALAQHLVDLPLDALYTSPMERARETAGFIAAGRDATPRVNDAFNEFDFGEWTNRTLAELDAAPGWREFNVFRSGARAPGGESMLEVQARVVRGLEGIRRAHPAQTVAVVSHGDAIRAALLHCLAMPLDFVHRLEVYPASVSVLELHDWGVRVPRINHTPQLVR